MALLDISLQSIEIELTTQVLIIYPDHLFNKKDVKVLFLLHGYWGSHLDWLRNTNIEQLANQYNLMVVMPSMNNSYYTNAVYGHNYFNYYAIELPNKIAGMFNLELAKENTYIAGLSMGGYGALKAALTKPDQYQGVASFSGALDIISINQTMSQRKNKNIGIFGDEETFIKNRKIHDLLILTDNIKNQDLDIYVSCGTEDFLYEHNTKFHEHLNNLKIEHKYVERKGDHNWIFWAEEIKTALEFFFSKEKN